MIVMRDHHPIVDMLAEAPWTFHLVGSRRFGKSRPHVTTDWDFLVDGSVENFKEQEELRTWLAAAGFKVVLSGGYSVDSYIEHWRYPAEGRSLPHVDVMRTRYKGDAELRLKVLMEMGKNTALREHLRDTSWAEFWLIIRWLNKPSQTP